MKNILYILFFIVVSYKATAQITYIPDPAFEQALIDLEIDSDEVINGQVLTSDVENVTELEIFGYDYFELSDLTGIQDFTSLEKLSITFSEITELDVSQNLQLKELDCSSNELTSLDVSSNTLLEKLYCGNYGIDVGPFNMIEEIDLSNNPNIYDFNAFDMFLKKINLKNGNNNSNMSIDVSIFPWGMDEPDYDPYEIKNTVCIEVDDEDLAQNNQYPYSEWNITHGGHVAVHFTDNVEACALNTQSFTQNKISIYPNPVSDMLYFETADSVIEKAIIFDLSGRKILEQNQVNTISVSDLQKGNYILKIFSDKGVQTEKVVVR
ncbi:MAG: T9SS type A sorting domain-containing protein [Flavobacteriaceae bacterium]